jgi:RHS repeat-associated protein
VDLQNYYFPSSTFYLRNKAAASGDREQLHGYRLTPLAAFQWDNQVFSYDQNGRLNQIQRQKYDDTNSFNESYTQQYTYPAGSNNNFSEMSHVLNGADKTTTATYDDQDRLLSLSGSINRNFSYNRDGDLESISNCFGTKSFEYDVFGNLKKVTLPSGKIITYKVDGLNRRVARYVNGQPDEYYTWFDQTRIQTVESADSSIRIQYVYGPHPIAPAYLIKNGVTYKIVASTKGDIAFVVGLDGSIVQETNYDAYGMILKDSSVTTATQRPFQPLGYVSGLTDFETGLVRFGARDYDPMVGRWTAKDPIGFAGGDTNLYGYVGQDPVSYADPSGLCPWCIGGAVGTIASGGAAYLTGGDARTVATAAAVGAVAGAASMGLSAFTSSATAAITANAVIGGGAPVLQLRLQLEPHLDL